MTEKDFDKRFLEIRRQAILPHYKQTSPNSDKDWLIEWVKRLKERNIKLRGALRQVAGINGQFGELVMVARKALECVND